jgi:hypothetical protein
MLFIFAREIYRHLILSQDSGVNRSLMLGMPIVDERLVWQGLEMTLAIISDLESQSRVDPNCCPKHIDMGMISECLKKFLGIDASEMIMQRVILKVDELSSVTM